MPHSEELPKQIDGCRERILSTDTGENVTQVSVEKKQEVNEAERFRKPIPGGKNPSVDIHEFQNKTSPLR